MQPDDRVEAEAIKMAQQVVANPPESLTANCVAMDLVVHANNILEATDQAVQSEARRRMNESENVRRTSLRWTASLIASGMSAADARGPHRLQRGTVRSLAAENA